MYKCSIITFVDILGFKKLVKEKSPKDIIRILSIPKEYFNSQPKDKYENIQISTFSDSIIISFKYTEEHAVYNLFLDLMNILIAFIQENIICRGAIVKGEIFHEQNFLFGQGFIDAYELEKKMKYPRIGFSKEILDIGCRYPDPKGTNRKEEVFIKTLCSKDDDDCYFIDYFSTPVSSVRSVTCVNRKDYFLKILGIINKGLSDFDPCVRDKYVWVKSKFKQILKNILIYPEGEAYEMIFKDIKKEEIKEILKQIL